MQVALTHAFCWPEVRRGGERYLHELANALARRGHSVTVIAGSSRWSYHVEDGVRTLRVRRSSGSGAADAERNFARRALGVLSLGRFDVVHSLGPHDAVAALRTPRNARTVYTCLGLPRKSSWNRLPAGAAHERVVAEIDVYGCLSKHALTILRDDWGRAGALTPGGVSLARFRPGRRSSEPTLLYAGALDEPRKGIRVLLDAVARLAKREPRVRLWLSGTGDVSGVLCQAPQGARERTEVLPLGTPDSLSEHYASAWATVLPSTNEAFGLVLVESLAAGTPIVGADHSAIPELVEPGVGFLAAPDDPEALADSCEKALALSREPGVDERCRRSASRHDWDSHVAPAVESLYMGDSKDANRRRQLSGGAAGAPT